MVLSDIQLFQSLKNKLGEKESNDLIEFIKEKSEQAFVDKSDILATKHDIFLLKEDLTSLRAEFKSDMHHMESKLTSKIYIIGLVQLVAIIGSVLSMVMLFVK